MRYPAKRIAKMIAANVKAVDAGIITWEQFGIVNRATWELADRDEPCVIGSPAARRTNAVQQHLETLIGSPTV